MRRRELHDDRWYKVVVNQKLEKGETYTYEIKGIGITRKILCIFTFQRIWVLFSSLL